MYGVFGLSFSGNAFENHRILATPATPSNYGIGIMAVDASFNIASTEANRTTFYGLGAGVHAGRIGANRPFSVYNARFTNCYFGINNLGVSGSLMLFNDFEMGKVQDVIGDEDQIGITLFGQMNGLTLQLNNFIAKDSNVENTLGIVVEDIGVVNHFIRQNKFDTLTIGNEAFGKNGNPVVAIRTGLTYLCNLNYHGVVNDFYVPDTTIYDEDLISRFQGWHTWVPNPTGNVFSSTGDPDDGDFGNYGVEVQYLYDGDITDQVPIDYHGIEPIEIGENLCDSIFCLQPCTPLDSFQHLVEGYYSDYQSYKGALFEEEYDLAAYYQVRIDSSLNLIMRYLEYDTLDFNTDTLKKWYLISNSISGDLMTAGIHFSEGEYTEAEERLDSIPIKYNLTNRQLTELNRLKNIYSILSGKTVFELDPADIDSLRYYSVGTGMSSAMARSALVFSDTVYQPRYYIPGEIVPRSKENQIVTSYTDYHISVYPNPVTSVLNIAIPENCGKFISMEVFDLYGRMISGFQLKTGINQISTEFLNDFQGMIYYRIRSDNRYIGKGRFVHISKK